jgi:hypothetical protein
VHTFSVNTKLCYVRDEVSGKYFLVDTGATLPLEYLFGILYTFAFLRADVPCPIVSLDFGLKKFGMQVNPSSPRNLITPQHCTQEGGTDGDGGSNAANSCFLVKKEATVPQPKAAAGARPIHTRIKKLLDEFPELLWPNPSMK